MTSLHRWFRDLSVEVAGGLIVALIIVLLVDAAGAQRAVALVKEHPYASLISTLSLILLVLALGFLGPRYRPDVVLGDRCFSWGLKTAEIQTTRDPMQVDESLAAQLADAIRKHPTGGEPSWTHQPVYDRVFETDKGGTWKRELRSHIAPGQHMIVSPRRS